MTLPNWITRILERRDDLRLTKVSATRAVFVDTALPPEVEMRLTLDDGLGTLTVRMTPQHARELISQLTNTYHAINPPLTNGQGAARWQGM